MGWSHPDISLPELMRHIKGFIDILLLASGYQSSGLPATWDLHNINKALRWGLFLEQVFKRLRDSDDYDESVEEFNAALLDITSTSYFPQGLVHVSLSTLSTARELILGHLLRTHPVGDAHLVSLLRASIELDLDDLTQTDKGSINMYLDKLMLQIESLKLIPEGNNSKLGSDQKPKSSVLSYTRQEEALFVGHSCFVIQEVLKRQTTVSCISSLEAGLDAVLKAFARNQILISGTNPSKGQPSDGKLKNQVMLTEFHLWNQWRLKCFSYLLNKRTIRILSGANLIFSAPKENYVRILESLRSSVDKNGDAFLETMEISLLGFISNRWSFLIEYFMSHSFEFCSISKLYSNLHDLLPRNPQSFLPENEPLDEKEKNILDYVTPLLAAQPHILWQLSPILVAAFPSWSILFRVYLSEMERQFSGVSSSIRCCSCSLPGKLHEDCEVAERIRCLSMFHEGSYQKADDATA